MCPLGWRRVRVCDGEMKAEVTSIREAEVINVKAEWSILMVAEAPLMAAVISAFEELFV